MSAVLHRLRFFVRQALGSMRQSPLVQLVAVSTIALAVAVLAACLMVLENVDRLAETWGAEVRLVVFLAPEASDADAERLRAQVVSLPEVERVTLRSREQALADFRAALGADAALVEGVGPDLLPASVEVGLRPGRRDEATLAALADRLRALPETAVVEDIAWGQDILERLRAFRDGLRLAGVVIAVLVALAVVFIVTNTVRLALFARRDEIEVMHLVGASRLFVRAPFYLEGALQGLLGAALAHAGLYAAWRLAVPTDDASVHFELGRLPLHFLRADAIAALALGTMAVSVIASHVAVGRSLRIPTPRG